MTKLTKYLHTAAAADYLGVAQNTLRKWAARGDIPMHRNPAIAFVMVFHHDIDAFPFASRHNPVGTVKAIGDQRITWLKSPKHLP